MSKIKVMYDVRYFIDENISASFASYSDKEEARGVAKFMSKKEDDRIYYIKKVTEQVIFFVGNRG